MFSVNCRVQKHGHPQGALFSWIKCLKMSVLVIQTIYYTDVWELSAKRSLHFNVRIVVRIWKNDRVKCVCGRLSRQKKTKIFHRHLGSKAILCNALFVLLSIKVIVDRGSLVLYVCLLVVG